MGLISPSSKVKELMFCSQGHTQCVKGKFTLCLLQVCFLQGPFQKSPFCILYKNKVRRVTGRWGVAGVKDTAYISWSWIMHHLHGQTWKHRKGKRGRISRLSSTIVSVHRLWPGTNLFWTTIPPLSWEVKGVLFSQVCFLITFLPIPSLNCNKSLTWMLGKIRVDQRVGRQAGRQAGRQGNNHLMFCFDFCFKSHNDRSHSSAVCFGNILKRDMWLFLGTS